MSNSSHSTGNMVHRVGAALMHARGSCPHPGAGVDTWLSTAGTRPRLSTGDGQPREMLRTLPGLCRYPPSSVSFLLPKGIERMFY